MNTVDRHSAARTFLVTHGHPLTDYGSAEYGLSVADALAFIQFIRERDLHVLGIEVWRGKGNRYKIDTLMTWYSVGSDVVRSGEEALNFIGSLDNAENDLLTVQYS